MLNIETIKEQLGLLKENKLSTKEIFGLLAKAKSAKATFSKVEKSLNEYLSEKYEQKIKDLRKEKGDDFGIVNMEVDGYKLSETISKKIAWDQEKMSEIFKKINDAGDDPLIYMSAKYGMTEASYKDLTGSVKDVFDEARTVSPGTVSVKLEETEDEL